MIEKIRRTLIIKYTLVITVILSLGFAASYGSYRHNGVKLLYDSLYDYLTEEVWEAEEFLNNYNDKTEIHKIKSDIKSLHNFSYWIIDKKIVHAEQPQNEALAKQLEQRLLTKNYEAGKIYHENMKNNRQKWYFIVIKQNLSLNQAQKGEVFVLANYTPIRKNAKTYIKIAFFAVGIMIILSYLLASFFVARSMTYIEQSYKKQKKFVSDAAHELRTPLAILYSYAELLEYNPQKKEVLSDIKSEILQMNDLVDKLLSLARYDNSTIALQKEPVLLNKIISEVISSMQHL
ncbi:MAG: HAMP domain-containing histidine kinase, partial [Alphaproteobacteria bacterium]|nr:HAMP domain-containing histidine kinase [Alphaproteobacteria bacterium]